MIINPSMSNIAPVQTSSTPAVSAPVVQEQSKQPESLGDSVSITIPAEVQKKSSSKKASKAHSVKAETKTEVKPEVKAETNLRSKSLRAYYDKFSPALALRISSSDYKDQGWMKNIPLWCVSAI